MATGEGGWGLCGGDASLWGGVIGGVSSTYTEGVRGELISTLESQMLSVNLSGMFEGQTVYTTQLT